MSLGVLHCLIFHFYCFFVFSFSLGFQQPGQGQFNGGGYGNQPQGGYGMAQQQGGYGMAQQQGGYGQQQQPWMQQQQQQQMQMQQMQQPRAAAGPTDADEKWARFYENDANAALQNGYTKAHYDAYLAKRQSAAPVAALPPAPVAAAVSANDEQWASFYLKDPQKATQSGYTQAHYQAYLAKKGGPAAGAPPPAAAPPAVSTLSANDHQWAAFYLKDPAKSAASGYTKAHYDDYLRKKNGGQ